LKDFEQEGKYSTRGKRIRELLIAKTEIIAIGHSGITKREIWVGTGRTAIGTGHI